MANSFPCHPTFRAVPLLKSLVLSMALPALQSSLKRKTGAQRRHQHASVLCSVHSTFSNPAAPDGPIYCTKWIVFGCTLYSQIFIWYPFRLSLPHSLSAHGISRTVWPVYGGCTAQQTKVTHASVMQHTVRLTNFASLIHREQKQSNKSLQAAPQAFPWGLNETQQENKENSWEKMPLLHNLRPQRDKLWEFCKQKAKLDVWISQIKREGKREQRMKQQYPDFICYEVLVILSWSSGATHLHYVFTLFA